MPTYISLINFTDQGIRTVTETTQRASAARQLATRMGGDMTGIYWTVGPYDIVTVSDFPDGETATAFLLGLGAQGNIRTTTMRAYTVDEMTGILGKLG
jgi:uncharacterized protein with GYD domain